VSPHGLYALKHKTSPQLTADASDLESLFAPYSWYFTVFWPSLATLQTRICLLANHRSIIRYIQDGLRFGFFREAYATRIWRFLPVLPSSLSCTIIVIMAAPDLGGTICGPDYKSTKISDYSSRFPTSLG
jgi:hypothetical protein